MGTVSGALAGRRLTGCASWAGTGAALNAPRPNAPSARSNSDLPFSPSPGSGILLCSVMSPAPSRDHAALDELDAEQDHEQPAEPPGSGGELLETTELQQPPGFGHR